MKKEIRDENLRFKEESKPRACSIGDEGRSFGMGYMTRSQTTQKSCILRVHVGSILGKGEAKDSIRFVLRRRIKVNLRCCVESAKMSSKPSSWLEFGIKFGSDLLTAQAVTGVEEA